MLLNIHSSIIKQCLNALKFQICHSVCESLSFCEIKGNNYLIDTHFFQGIGQMVNLSFRIAITLPPLNVNIDGDPVPVARRDYLRQSQLDTLRASYTTNSAQLSTDELTSLTTQTGLSGRQIWIWFYNQVTLDFKELVEKGEPVMVNIRQIPKVAFKFDEILIFNIF